MGIIRNNILKKKVIKQIGNSKKFLLIINFKIENSDIIEGVYTIKIFAASNDVLKPYEYSKSFIIISENKEIPNTEIINGVIESEEYYWHVLLIISILIGIATIVIRKSRFSSNNK